MEGKIALEEHFAIPETINEAHDARYTGWLPAWPDIKRRLFDLEELRLPEMDKYGIELVILALHNHAVPGIPGPKRAPSVARKATDLLAVVTPTPPGRFA